MKNIFKKAWGWLTRFRRGHGISLLVPFNAEGTGNRREENWNWLRRYWREHLPAAQIVIGIDPVSAQDPCIPFSKACAVNNAASRATGDIFVIVDADAYVDADAVLHCAKRIREERKKHHRLWFVPYRLFFRLTKEASDKVLESCPEHPYEFPTPPPMDDIQNCSGSQLGHWYGAMIQILPREAFYEVGGWDPRFRGWGGEDHAAMRATDTLYWLHKTLPIQVLHLWHPMLHPGGSDEWVDWQYRMWENQPGTGANDDLSGRYYGANGDRKRMRKLVEEGFNNEVD